ncbi:MAG: hypothetical protein ACR2KC_03705, partial [Acidimicrobiales bacterium]
TSTANGTTVAAGVPSASKPAVQVNLGCSTGIGLNLVGVPVLCQLPAPGSASSSAAAAKPATGVAKPPLGL